MNISLDHILAIHHVQNFIYPICFHLLIYNSISTMYQNALSENEKMKG